MESGSCLLDQHIREALRTRLYELDSTASIIEEMPLLRGKGRADLAFVNGSLCGYEIKSGADSLVRLGMQTQNYEAVFELNTLVAANRHIALAKKRLPETWGIIEAKQIDGRIELRQHRKALRNSKFSKSALARLLWKNECLRILRMNGVEVRPNASVLEVWNFVETLETKRLCHGVREALKRRPVRVAE
jgi:hypothetical protein